MDAPRENFRLVAADVQQDGLPDLADPEMQQFLRRNRVRVHAKTK